MRVLITGGSGELGIRLTRLLVERGHEVTVASRSARPMRDVAAVEMDLAAGTGVESVAGHDTVVHLASNPFEAQRVDVAGTQRLVDAAAAAGVDHLLAISIVGIDDHPYPYYRAKAEMERIVQKGDVPWTILRATQFHSLVPRLLDMLPAVGFVPVPRGVSLQPVDVAVVAERLAELVEAGPSGRVADLGGPEVVPLSKMVKDVLGAKRLRRLIIPLPLPPRLGTGGAERDDEVVTADAHDATVARAVSPLVRPDPCDPGPFVSENLALDRAVTASAEENDTYAAVNAVDGSDATWWSAAEGPPQWIEIDLGESAAISRVEILIGHVSPPGPQTHRIRVRADGEAAPGKLVGEVSANARQGDWLIVEFDAVSDVRFVRIETVAVDGWVILHEIRVLAG